MFKQLNAYRGRPSHFYLYGVYENFSNLVSFGAEVIGRKPQTGNYHQNFRGPRSRKLWVRSEKVKGYKNGTDVLYTHATFGGNRWTQATGDEKRCFFVCMFVCMFVTLDVQERGPDVQQRIMSPFVEQFQCGFHCFSQKELTEKFVSTTSTI